MDVIIRLLGLLVLLGAGTGLRLLGVLEETRTARLNALAYYVALPALLFVATYDQPIGSLVSVALAGGVVVVFLATAGIAWVFHAREATPARRSVAVVQSYHANLGYLGVPLIAATFDDGVTAAASVILGVGALVQVPLTVAILVAVNGTETSVRAQSRRLLANPVLLALVAGLGVGSAEIAVPDTAVAGLDVLAAFALPLAVLCVGASLDPDLPTFDRRATGRTTVLKMACMPAIAWVVFATLGVDADAFVAAVVMLAMPTAVSTYVFSSELGGDARFASVNVFATTVVSVATLALVIGMLGYSGP